VAVRALHAHRNKKLQAGARPLQSEFLPAMVLDHMLLTTPLKTLKHVLVGIAKEDFDMKLER
jgi:hypothetical protein